MPSRPRVAANQLLTAEQAAGLLHLHVKRVQLLARQGRLPAIRHGRRWLFERARLLDRDPAPPSSPIGDAIDISARNLLRGRVRSVVADGLMAEVTLALEAQELVAVITKSSAQRLGLARGLGAVAVVKSTEVMIARRRRS
jgi:molybdopterin-binding protein